MRLISCHTLPLLGGPLILLLHPIFYRIIGGYDIGSAGGLVLIWVAAEIESHMDVNILPACQK